MCHHIVAAAILLIKAAQQWQQQHNDKLPSTSAQRTEFKNIIKSWQRQIEGIPLEVPSFSLFTHIKSCLGARTVVTANVRWLSSSTLIITASCTDVAQPTQSTSTHHS